MRKATVLVLHYKRGNSEYPLRSSVEDHLFAWRRYSSYDVVYVNAGYHLPIKLLARLDPAAVVFHTSLLSTRWSRPHFQALIPQLLRMRDWSCAKIAMPQDEFTNTDILDDFLAEVGTSHVLTCAAETDWANIYPRTSASGAAFTRILTGYLDEQTIARVAAMAAPQPRPIDIGYRAWKAAPWLGQWGRHKVDLAVAVTNAASQRGMVVDVSVDGADTLLGDDWFRFLLSCRATIGVEGGASILDRDGGIKARVDEFQRQFSDAGSDEVAAACFPDAEGSLNLMAISPRHLEACLTRTMQILVEGEFNGVLQAEKHYFPVKSDYSNLGEALDFLSDETAVREMTDRAYADVVGSEAVTYRRFIRKFDDLVSAHVSDQPEVRPALGRAAIRSTLRGWDELCWRRVRAEARWISQDSRLTRLALQVYRGARKAARPVGK